MTANGLRFVATDRGPVCASLTCLVVLLIGNSSSADDGLLDESRITFTSVANALASLSARNDTSVGTQDGWTVVVERDGAVVWSFVPKGHAAYPAVVKRTVVTQPDGVYVQMASLCESTANACDKLVQEFRDLNAELGKSYHQ